MPTTLAARPRPCSRLRAAAAVRTVAAALGFLAAAPFVGAAPTLEPAAIYDVGAGAPVKAIDLQVPAGWKARGGIRWNQRIECIANQVRVEWSASSPDRLQAVELLPGFSWQVAGYEVPLNPCPVAPIASARDYLTMLAQSLYPGAQIVGWQDRFDLVPPPPAPQTLANGARLRTKTDAGQIVLAYAQDGREVRESLLASVLFTEMTMAGMRPSIVGGVSQVFVVRAPKDRFDAELGEAVRRTFRIDPQWQAMVDDYARRTADAKGAAQRAEIDRWHQRRMAEISAKGAADRAAIRSNTIREIGEINSAGWKSRMASMDRQHQRNLDAVREEARYVDPTTNRAIALSSHYNHGFRTAGGAYVATDDPNFKPGAGGFEMKPIR